LDIQVLRALDAPICEVFTVLRDELSRSFVIGRVGDVALEDDTVSRQHARLEISDSSLFLYDLSSRNGTFEIRGEDVLPFANAEIYIDQVFASGTCVRSVRQLLCEIGVDGQWRAKPDQHDKDRMNVTQSGLRIAASGMQLDPRTMKICARIAEGLAEARSDGHRHDEIDVNSHNSAHRMQRSDDAAAKRDESIVELCQEIELLRQSVADLTRERDAAQRVAELSLERIALQNALIAHTETVDLEPSPYRPADSRKGGDGPRPSLAERQRLDPR